MIETITDTALYLKAKILRDQLMQNLLIATSQQNWQTSSHILHQLANAAYNYDQWQRMNQFIMDKLKRKQTWRKILKSLNIVDFLLKNGPPSIIKPLKYQNHRFKQFVNYQFEEDGNDRGQSIRQRASIIVQLLDDEQLLQDERQKALKIRQKMASVLGKQNYGNKSSSNTTSKYESYSSQNYQQQKSKNSSYFDQYMTASDKQYENSYRQQYPHSNIIKNDQKRIDITGINQQAQNINEQELQKQVQVPKNKQKQVNLIQIDCQEDQEEYQSANIHQKSNTISYQQSNSNWQQNDSKQNNFIPNYFTFQNPSSNNIYQNQDTKQNKQQKQVSHQQPHKQSSQQPIKDIVWLDDKEKKLIDFTDFSKQLKNNKDHQPQSTSQSKKEIKIDLWNW